MIRSIFCSAWLTLLLLSSCRHANLPDEIIKSASSDKGVVVSAHPLASAIGLQVLKYGGTAADAAVAVQFALAVVYPRAGNLGGGGFMVYRDSSGEISTLNFREKAPLAASRDMYLDSSGQVINGLSLNGILAAGVPGTVAGLAETHKRFGKLPWLRLIEPAIKLARKGFHITAREAKRLNENRDAFLAFNKYETPFTAKDTWKAGDLLVQKDLAQTLTAIAEDGRSAFYNGQNANSLVAFCKANHGLITREDLTAYTAEWKTPLVNHWSGYDLYSMGLPSSGGIVLGQILKMIEGKLVDSLGNRNIQNVHLIVEAERRAFQDRAEFLGDDDFFPVPIDSILDTAYLKNKFADFDPLHATPSNAIGKNKSGLIKEHYETTHLTIADMYGNVACVTTTLNNNYGSKVWVPGCGYFLNDEMDDFSVKPGEPNLFGLVGAEANAIAPGKRMLSSMTPTIIEKNGKFWMALGTPGGSTIITSVLQVFLNAGTFGMHVDEAVSARRYHHQWLPDEITYEQNAFSPALENQLDSMGYHLHAIEGIGSVEAILLDDEGKLHGAADPRGDDHVSAW